MLLPPELSNQKVKSEHPCLKLLWKHQNCLNTSTSSIEDNYKVSLYIDRPWQCYRCQQFGHNTNGCHAQLKCVVCAGRHNVKDCESRIPKCSNCGNSYTANYGGCSYMKKAKIVEKVRAEKKLSYRDACLHVNALHKTQPNNNIISQPSGQKSPIISASPTQNGSARRRNNIPHTK